MIFSLPVSVTQKNAVQLERDPAINFSLLKKVDCADLTDFDSTVLTVLLAWQKKLHADGRVIAIDNAPEKLKVLAGVYGVAELLGLS